MVDSATIGAFARDGGGGKGRCRRRELAGATGTDIELGVTESELNELRAGEVEARVRSAQRETE